MGSAIIVRKLNPGNKSWIRQEAASRGISMEEFVRRLINESRRRSQESIKPSEAFQQYFGQENGIELPVSERYGYKPVALFGEDET